MRIQAILLAFCLSGPTTMVVAVTRAAESAVASSEFIWLEAPFPQCHASTIAKADDGNLVAAWFAGTHEKNPDVGIWVSRRVDGAWTVPVEVANGVQSKNLRYPTWNPVLFQPRGGPLMLFFKVGPSPRQWWGEMMVSDDGGKTWKDRHRLPDKGIGPVKNKPIQMADGSIWCPSSTEHDGWRIHLEVTRDLGKTWTSTGPLNAKDKGAIQPSLLTYSDGRQQMLCRNQDGKGKLWQTWSADRGKTWSPLQPTPLPNPNAGTDAVTLSDGRQLLVYNHTNRGGPFPQGREMLNVAITRDGKKWSAAMVLERSKGEHSYPAVIQTADGRVHIAYTWKRKRVRHVVLDPNKLTTVEIKNGKWPEGVERLPEAVAKKEEASSSARSEPPKFERIKFRSPKANVDLGVGLWAWPLPMDWDQDGDLDLVVGCPDVPFAGIYLFENPGGDRKMPVFKPPVQVGPRHGNISVSYVNGEPRVLIPGQEFVDFRARKFAESRKIYPKSNLHENRVRANQWKYVDYDGDGALDLVVGVGDWTEYGWDNAYNREGKWTRGPLRGFVYLLRNEATTDKPQYAQPRRLLAGGKTLDVYGMPSPNFADFDGDGDLDLLCGEFLDGFTYFQNLGSRTAPKLAKGRRLQQEGQSLAMDLQMIVPVAIDWDGDGDTDLVVGDEDGRVALVEHTGKLKEGVPQFLPPKYFQQQADNVKFGALVTPVSVDWDTDGDEDLICGNTAGYIGFIENLDGGDPPRWAPPRRLQADGRTLRILAGPTGSIQGPCEAKWGYTTIDVADWNHDGLLDIVANSIWGKVVWYENVGVKKSPRLAAAKPIQVAWPAGSPAPKPAWNWWNPEDNELATQWRTTPVVIDLDRDGLNDLVMLDHEGYLAFFRRERSKDQLVLHSGQRVFTDADGKPLRLNANQAGRSGRRKWCFADWDGDGALDLLVNSRNISLFRNVSKTKRSPSSSAPWAFQDKGEVGKLRLAGHTTSPTVVDWNRDGRPDLLAGAEDGHLYYLRN